jgi:hypothetical protein
MLAGLPPVGDRYRHHAAKSAAGRAPSISSNPSSTSSSSSSTQPKPIKDDEDDLEWDFGDDSKGAQKASSSATPNKKVGLKGFSEYFVVYLFFRFPPPP